MSADLLTTVLAGGDNSGTPKPEGGAGTSRSFGPAEIVQIVVANAKLLVLGPVLAGIVAFGVASLLPKWYTSVVYLRLDEAQVRAADADMRSNPILDRVLADYTPDESTVDARRAHIEKNRRIVVAPGETERLSKLFRMEYSDRDPATAQKVNSLLLAAWLESTRPAPDRRAQIEAELERTEAQAKTIAGLVDRLQKDAPSLVAAQSRQGELATPILGLIAKRDENQATVLRLRHSLNGLSKDVVFGAPNLPDRPSWPQRGVITILATVTAGLLLIAFVIVSGVRSTRQKI